MLREGFQIIAVKFAAIVVGAGALFSLFTGIQRRLASRGGCLLFKAPKKASRFYAVGGFAGMPVRRGTRYKFATLPR
jgi:hypothetical protein